MKKFRKQNNGFTLIELLVSMGILVIMTGIVLANYRDYNSNALFANASEDIVLSLRQAQVYGVGVKGCGAADPFDCSYGLHLSTSESQKNGFVVFADIDGDRIFNSAIDTAVSRTTWNSKISISGLSCDGVSCGSSVYITFQRPNPDAFIATTANAAVSMSAIVATLTDSSTSKTATVTISHAGQISIQ